MDQLYSAQDLVAATGGRLTGPRVSGVSGVSFDSRDMPEGGLFAAIKGLQLDGHDYVEAAFENGAGLAMVAEARAEQFSGLPLLVVPDVLKGLEALGTFARNRSEAQIVAVTGSVGKTTTKELIRAALAEEGETHAALKSFNNHWGVPLTLARLAPSARFGVFEIGMNHAGEITPLAKLVRPQVAVITSVAPVHLEAFESVAGIARAKAEIMAGLTPGGTLILGADHAHFDLLLALAAEAGVARVISYGFCEKADAVISDYAESEGVARAKLAFEETKVEVAVHAKGRHVMANAVCALMVARACGVPDDTALAGIARFALPEGRGTRIRLAAKGPKALILVDESYNANPASMRAALDVFAHAEAEGGARVLVLGDMFELGETSPQLHAELADAVRAARPDRVFLVGAMMAHLRDSLGVGAPVEYAENLEMALDTIPNALAPGDLVVVKGSNGLRLGRLVAAIKERFGASQ